MKLLDEFVEKRRLAHTNRGLAWRRTQFYALSCCMVRDSFGLNNSQIAHEPIEAAIAAMLAWQLRSVGDFSLENLYPSAKFYDRLYQGFDQQCRGLSRTVLEIREQPVPLDCAIAAAAKISDSILSTPDPRGWAVVCALMPILSLQCEEVLCDAFGRRDQQKLVHERITEQLRSLGVAG